MQNELNQAIAGVGHNNPPVMNPGDNVVERLTEANNDMIARYDELTAAAARLPKECADEATAQKITTFANQLKACADTLEERRKTEKRPYDDLANAVHQFFKGRTDTLTAHVNSAKAILKRYIDAEALKVAQAAEAARVAAAEEAELKRKEAEQHLSDAANLEDAGLAGSADVALAQAQEAEQQATVAQQAADAPAQKVTVAVRGAVGGMASSTGTVKCEVVSMKTIDLEVLRDHLALADVEKALRAYLKVAIKQQAKDAPLPEVKGARIYRDTNISLRG